MIMNDSNKKDVVAFNYYLLDDGLFQVITWTADELPADEDEWEEAIENSIQNHYTDKDMEILKEIHFDG